MVFVSTVWTVMIIISVIHRLTQTFLGTGSFWAYIAHFSPLAIRQSAYIIEYMLSSLVLPSLTGSFSILVKTEILRPL